MFLSTYKKCLSLCFICLLFSSQLQAREVEEPGAEEMVTDLLVVRPMMIGTTIIGTGLFAVSLPFSLLGGNADEAAEKLVAEPADAAVTRCLGCH